MIGCHTQKRSGTVAKKKQETLNAEFKNSERRCGVGSWNAVVPVFPISRPITGRLTIANANCRNRKFNGVFQGRGPSEDAQNSGHFTGRSGAGRAIFH